MKKPLTIDGWYALGVRRLGRILKETRSFRGLVQLGPAVEWNVDLKWVNRATMTRLNHAYRQREYPTDILSFPALGIFRDKGLLGELVICLPVLKSQARSFKHSSKLELDVLLIHGVLHLLGLDHETDAKQAVRMARWEGRLLKAISPVTSRSRSSSLTQRRFGLIDRSTSGIKNK